MNVTCGNETIDISRIESVIVREVTKDELLKIEQKKNGNYISAGTVFSPILITDFKAIFVDFKDDICSRFPEPLLTKADLDAYASDHKDFERIENWEKLGANELTLLSSFDNDGDATIRWSFNIWNPHASSAMDTIVRAHRIILLSQIIPILKALVDLPKPKNVWESVLAGYSYKKIQKYIRPVYDEYMQGKRKIDLRNETKQYFLDCHAGKYILCITLYGESSAKKYLDGCCAFDIFEKEKEIQSCLQKLKKYQQKERDLNNDMEKVVGYVPKWFMATDNSYAVPIKNDCEEKDAVRIKIVGIGGCGSCVINRMMGERLPMVEYVSIDTDNEDEAIKNFKADIRLQIGLHITKGRGANNNPEIGRLAAEGDREQITEAIKDCDVLFIIAGMGGGTGTGAVPVVADIAHCNGIFTIAAVTMPFDFEGLHRMQQAASGIELLQTSVDTLIVIPNILDTKKLIDEVFKQLEIKCGEIPAASKSLPFSIVNGGIQMNKKQEKDAVRIKIT